MPSADIGSFGWALLLMRNGWTMYCRSHEDYGLLSIKRGRLALEHNGESEYVEDVPSRLITAKDWDICLD